MAAPEEWTNRAPGNLDDIIGSFRSGDPNSAVAHAVGSFESWGRKPLDERIAALASAKEKLAARSEELAVLIARETGKPLREARLEMAAVLAKFDLTFADAREWLAETPVTDGPHPAAVRRRPRGPAAVIAPFNFPVHLGHGAALGFLTGGNPVVFKPSPLAAAVGELYGSIMQDSLPPGVFSVVQGGAAVSRAICLDPRVRAVCFTGSIPVGRALACDLAADYSKVLALELGGKNSVIVWSDAAVESAAAAVANGLCLTTGQRCNATSRVLVHRGVRDAFLERLLARLAAFVPGDPLDDKTMLGPLVNEAAVARYREATTFDGGEWILPGRTLDAVSGKRGHYVFPAVVSVDSPTALDASVLATRETFAPVLVIETVDALDAAIKRHNAWSFGLTASVFTSDATVFETLAASFPVGNFYRNLPTTFSPSTLPFGGWGASGNSRPGGRGFVRFTVDEQAVQWKD